MAIIIGLEGGHAAFWNVYSESVRPGEVVQGEMGYNFYEAVVDALRPSVRDGIKSVLVAAPHEGDYEGFTEHVRKHQGWLLNGWSLNTVTFEHITESALDVGEVRELVSKQGFRERLTHVTEGDVKGVMGDLERRLSDADGIETVLFTLREVEAAVYGDGKSPQFILVTDAFMSRHGRRTHRLLQVAANKDVKTRIIKTGTTAGARITQFGGLVCML